MSFVPHPGDRPLLDRPAVTVTVTGGYDDAFRVLSMLRSRAYRVTSLDLSTEPGASSSRLRFALDGDRTDVRVLLARLHRLPAVLAADVTD